MLSFRECVNQIVFPDDSNPWDGVYQLIISGSSESDLGDNTSFPVLNCRSSGTTISVLSVENRNVAYIYGTESEFNTASMVHKGFTIPIRSHFKSIRCAVRVLRVGL
jgi:hypothetical protein